MGVGERLREERVRLGLSQPAFAALAGASKGAQQNWEKDSASPNATALIAFADAGADVLYILTGRRTTGTSVDEWASLRELISEVRRDLLVEDWEEGELGEERVMNTRSEQLEKLLIRNASKIPEDLAGEVESLIAILNSPVQRAAFRAADHAQMRARRKQMRETIGIWTDLGDYQPNEAVLSSMTTIALDYSVPVRLLAELVYEIVASDDGGGFRSGTLAEK